LIITTNDSNIITLTPFDCGDNFNINDTGYCVCNGGYYYVDDEECSECSVMCTDCNGPNVGDCTTYSSYFYVVIIVPTVVALAIIVVIVFIKTRKRKIIE
jgi:hypothetical protein